MKKLSQEEKIKKLQSDSKMYKERSELYWKKYNDLQKEYSNLRFWIEGMFKWWAELIATDKTPNLKYLINEAGKILKYWGDQ